MPHLATDVQNQMEEVNSKISHLELSMDTENASIERLVSKNNVQIIHVSARRRNRLDASPRDSAIEENTVHWAIKPTEIDDAFEKEQTQNQ